MGWREEDLKYRLIWKSLEIAFYHKEPVMMPQTQTSLADAEHRFSFCFEYELTKPLNQIEVGFLGMGVNID